MLSGQSIKASIAIAAIFVCRIFGLMAVLPVLGLYHGQYSDATPATIGLAIGAYGLTQALLQMPMGMWSDTIGRKRVIALGLTVLALGSVLCAVSNSIWGVVIGRALQGAGAVGSTLLALLADVVDRDQLSRCMMLVGMTIGMSFGVSIVVGPWLDGHGGLQSIFYLTAALALLGIGLLAWVVPNPTAQQQQAHYLPSKERIKSVLKHPALRQLDLSICCAHAIFTLLFVALPGVLHAQFSQPSWQLYLPVMLAAVLVGFPLVMTAERRHVLKKMLHLQILVLAISLIALYSKHTSFWVVGLSLAGFFTAFTVLEALLPSLVSRFSPKDCRGTAMGVFSSSQYAGIFLGGAGGGWLQTHWGPLSVWWVAAALSGLWLLVVWRLPALPDKVNN